MDGGPGCEIGRGTSGRLLRVCDTLQESRAGFNRQDMTKNMLKVRLLADGGVSLLAMGLSVLYFLELPLEIQRFSHHANVHNRQFR